MAKTYKKITLTFVTPTECVKDMTTAIHDMLDITHEDCPVFKEEIVVTDDDSNEEYEES